MNHHILRGGVNTPMELRGAPSQPGVRRPTGLDPLANIQQTPILDPHHYGMMQTSSVRFLGDGTDLPIQIIQAPTGKRNFLMFTHVNDAVNAGGTSTILIGFGKQPSQFEPVRLTQVKQIIGFDVEVDQSDIYAVALGDGNNLPVILGFGYSVIQS